MLNILYRERRAAYDDSPFSDNPGLITDLVEVTLRAWSEAGEEDVIMESRGIVDGELIFHTKKCMDENTTATLQRQAMANFDNMLANHPTLSKGDRDE